MRWSVLVIAVAVVACGPSRPTLLETPLPDLARQAPSVRAQIERRHASVVAAVQNRHASRAALAVTFGEYGMLLQAAEYFDAAKPAYLNAQALAPQDPRWPYYLALVYRAQGDTVHAAASLRRVLELRPDDVPSLVWLGRTYLDQGDASKAEPLFSHARMLAPQSVAVLAGLGQVALARRDYPQAIALLERALSINPGLASLHSPLAQAYRGVGDTQKAEAHLAQWKNTEVPLADPLRDQLDTILDSGLSYELRGVQALETHKFDEAEQLFRKGLAVTPAADQLARSLHHKLGTALYLKGDVPGAQAQFDAVTRMVGPDVRDEPAAQAAYSLGVMFASSGRDDDAIAQLRSAVTHDPTYVEAMVALGDVLAHKKDNAGALRAYGDAVRVDPRRTDARLAYTFSLVRLHRWADVRSWLAESVRVEPDHPELANALARVYAAAPDDRVRDGRKAFEITQGLLKTLPRTTALGETMAMVMAELGNFGEAVNIQRDIMDAAARAGRDTDVRRMRANLQLYTHDRACRTPWTNEEMAESRTHETR